MNRISQRLDTLREQGRKALVTYVVHGDPDPSITVDALHCLVESGADILELGVPFSDPMAEGPVIQRGHERALAAGASLNGVLDVVKAFRLKDETTPIVLMGYANPVERMGYSKFAELASSVGVDGLLTVDLPPEESKEASEVLRQHNINMIYLVAPTTSSERMASISECASGFVYYVSLKGVTGAGNLDIASVKEKIDQLRKITQLPLMVGFGIKDAQSAQAVAQHADGVVVGSALVKAMEDVAAAAPEKSTLALSVTSALREIVQPIRLGLDELSNSSGGK